MEIGQHHAARLARGARSARVVEHLDEDSLRLHVVVLVARALQRDVAHLDCGIDVGHRHAPGFAHLRTLLRVKRLGLRAHFAQAGKRKAALEGEARELRGHGLRR